MVATWTNKFRTNLTRQLEKDFKNTDNSFYIMIGKADAWSDSLAVTTDSTAPRPDISEWNTKLLYANASSLKRISPTDIVYMIPRIDWVTGTSYTAYNDRDADLKNKNFYVMTDEYKVYKCLKKGSGTSVNKPVSISAAPSTLADGYMWKYMLTLSADEISVYLTEQYIPIKNIILEDGEDIEDFPEEYQERYDYQVASAAIKGKIYNITIANGGSGYTSTPTLTVEGNGTGCTATATVTGQVITGVTITANGSGYNIASVRVSGGGGSGAVLYPVLEPEGGHGINAQEELYAHRLYVKGTLTYDQIDGDLLINNEFRQLAIVKNPLDQSTGQISIAETLIANKGLQFDSWNAFAADEVITGNTSNAKAFVDSFNNSTGYLRFHQNEKTGFGKFVNGETVVGNATGSGVLEASGANIAPEMIPFSGDIIYCSNHSKITRTVSKEEKILIGLFL